MNTVRARAVLLLLAAATLVPLAAGAQVRITGAITGLVTDPSDAVIPGATVQLVDEGTGITKETVTNTSGVFQFLDLNSGRYAVSVTLQGFQTAKYDHVVVEASRSTDLRVKLAVGATTETVTVSGAAPVLETSQNTISNTLDRKQITELPLNSRDAFSFARLVPGAVALPGASGSTAGQSGSTHYNGMPGGTINPTLDGVNNSSNGFKSGGTSFFGTVPARLGAVEEITVESAGLGGDAGVEGGVNLKFVTRRGTRNYHASAFDQLQNDILNANSYFNTSRGIAERKVRQHDFGFNFGGPLVPTGKWRDKLFLFINYEQQYLPLTQTRSNVILTQEAEQGIFRYQTAAGEQRTVNLLDIAAANGFPAAKGSVDCGHPRERDDRARARRRRVPQSAHRHALVAAAADEHELLPHGPHGLPDQLQAVVDGELESLSPGPARPSAVALRGAADPARYVPRLVVGHLHRVQLAVDEQHLQRVPLRRAAQRRHHAAP
jgi:hypothetical protein